jgi:hypothetical protein
VIAQFLETAAQCIGVQAKDFGRTADVDVRNFSRLQGLHRFVLERG